MERNSCCVEVGIFTPVPLMRVGNGQILGDGCRSLIRDWILVGDFGDDIPLGILDFRLDRYGCASIPLFLAPSGVLYSPGARGLVGLLREITRFVTVRNDGFYIY